MQYTSSILLLAFAATNVLGHGVVTEIQGANNVVMPGLSVADGTPRDCATPSCGAEADTSIIRANSESPLGKTNGAGTVTAAPMVAAFMDGSAANTSTAIAARELHMAKRAILARAAAASGGAGTKTPQGTSETGVAAATGQGATSGLPTCTDDGTINMTFHQVNQDGAGPLTASVDPTSGGTSEAAFQDAQVTTNVPGIGIGGLSAVTTTDFPIAVQMPAGMTCSGTVSGVNGVCIAKVQNSALAGPFGGSVAFTQSAAAKKRAIEYNLSKRRFARGIIASNEQ